MMVEDGYSIAHIADLLGLTEKTVRNRLLKAKLRILKIAITQT